jgi:hypothetical protein
MECGAKADEIAPLVRVQSGKQKKTIENGLMNGEAV